MTEPPPRLRARPPSSLDPEPLPIAAQRSSLLCSALLSHFSPSSYVIYTDDAPFPLSIVNRRYKKKMYPIATPCSRCTQEKTECFHNKDDICHYYCKQKQHKAYFCPARPNNTAATEEKHSSFVEELLLKPTVNVTAFSGMSTAQAMKKVEEDGARFNRPHAGTRCARISAIGKRWVAAPTS
jgi:hypothetical protein